MSGEQHPLPLQYRLESYEFTEVLGVGGFGVTYRAYDHSLLRDVAIKEYLPYDMAVRAHDGETVLPRSPAHLEDFEWGLQRFLDEGRTLAQFHEPAIVRVMRFVESNRTAYLVLGYEKGETLGERLKRSPKPSESELMRMAEAIFRGLGIVHAHHILHRDIKPDNIFVRENGTSMLIDFGSARKSVSGHTMQLTAITSPGFSPLEQYDEAAPEGPWTDLYSFGVTLFVCMAGKLPHGALARLSTVRSGQRDPIETVLSRLSEEYSVTFVDGVRWMLQPLADHRPQSAAEAGERLLRGLAEAKPPIIKSPATAPTALIEPALMQRARSLLALRLGPIAALLVEKATASSRTSDEFVRVLASKLNPGTERELFLKELHPGKKTPKA